MGQSQTSIDSSAQSRIGKRPVPVPDGVQVTVEGNRVQVKGPKGSLERVLPSGVTVETADKNLLVLPVANTGRDGKRLQGLARALVANMVEGVNTGFAATLDLHGVGYRVDVEGQNLSFALGFSHPVRFSVPEGVTVALEVVDQAGVKRPRLQLKSTDKELLGQTVARIRALKPPEPYKGKGIRRLGERIREKAGKSAAKGQ